MERSRIPNFYKFSVTERLSELHTRGIINDDDLAALTHGHQVLTSTNADKMVENVVGVLGLPLGLGLNFLINDKDYVIPMAVEEASIIAALSSAAKLVRQGGGFRTESTEPVLIGQVQVVEVAHPTKAQQSILQNRDAILNLANSLHPNMVARGGGARDVEVRLHPQRSGAGDMLVVHLLVDTRDAMGANLVNTMCEGIAPLIEELTCGKVFLRILSNLTDRSMVTAHAVIPTSALASKNFTGEQVRDGIILANDFAIVDPYRATTHNKGIMNGIDAVAIATGNDWRAIEAAAHAYAGRGPSYTALTKWNKDAKGNLVGSIEMPLKVGTVGGNLQSNPSIGISHRILQVGSARELAEVMGAVGLAQNFSALKALATEGIQQGHMTLHARSVVASAGVPPELFDAVIEKLLQSGDIKVWKAQEILQGLRAAEAVTEPVQKPAPARRKDPEMDEPGTVAGNGKVVLLGEHAVVYGTHAIAAPIPLAVRAKVEKTTTPGVQLLIPPWGVDGRLHRQDSANSLHQSLHTILTKLRLENRDMAIKVYPQLPRAMGLGGSAALAVAVVRALSACFDLKLSNNDVNALAFESEQVAHGTASGIDNALATFGQFAKFRMGRPPLMQNITVKQPIPIVIGMSGVESLTAKMVAQVRRAWQKNTALYDGIFADIDHLVLEAEKAIAAHDIELLGELMNINQGLLNALQVSSWELEELIEVARKNGAVGAKLTGGGGGGSMVALCPDNQERVADAMRRAGYRTFCATLG